MKPWAKRAAGKWLHRFGEQEQAAGDGGAAEADEEAREAAANEAGELGAEETAEHGAADHQACAVDL